MKNSMFCLFFFALLFCSGVLFSSADVTGDPMVKITSLPLEQDLDSILPLISKDVSEMTGLPETFITYYWSYFETIYCPGCEKAGIKRPVFVDLYVPGFMSEGEIQTVMKSIAVAIENHTDYDKKDLFIHTHVAEKYQLYIMGDIVTNWSQVGGPDD
ncbi:MAG TPA: hypothetical protein PLO84_09725 [Thermotogota bacterium]|nr:hypothetical protein [Thermotogota bacterium]HPJ89385.1 hypothetical protein [Thermotogota bacterium]